MMLNICLDVQDSTVAVQVNGQPSHTFPITALRFTEQDAQSFISDPSPYGKRLFDALFADGSPAQKAFSSLKTADRLILRMDDPRLAGVPWEYLHDGKRWLAAYFALVRARIEDQPPVSRFGAGRARLLFVPAEPLLVRGVPQPYKLGLDQEWDNLEHSLRELDAACDLVKVLPPTINALQRSLSRAGNNIVHFTGHGAQSGEDTVLFFEDPSGTGAEVPGSDFRLGVEGAALVVLSACETAMEGTEEAANLSAALAEEGIPYVLGMQIRVPDSRAREFTTIFYENLFAGRDVPEAARRARFALRDDPFVMGIPVLWAADPAAEDHLNTEETGLRVDARATRVELSGVRKANDGFFGRQRELVEVGRLIMPERPRRGHDYPPLTVTLKGAGGIGKTAMLHKAAERFAWRFRDGGVLGLSLEPLPTPAEVLARVEKFFGLPDGSVLEPAARANAVSEALTGRMALLALDNYETILHARAGDDETKKKDASTLHRFFETLPARGLTLLISSRALTRLPGEQVVNVPGLDDLSGAEVFRSRVQSRARELNGKGPLLYALNQRVGGHALALRLLGPIFDRSADPTPEAFVARVDSVLPQAAEIYNDEERHDTLEKCFAFSLDALQGEDEPLRVAIARLSLFQGGFLDLTAEAVLFGWTEDKEKTQEQRNVATQILRALEERGLLERRERAVDGGTLQFYNVHPALRPFATALLNAEDLKKTEDDSWQIMSAIARRAFPHEEEGRWLGIQSEPWLVEIVRAALPDLLRSARMRNDKDGSLLRFHLAQCLANFGDYDGAMQFYQESLAIDTGLGNNQGRSSTLFWMAKIHSTRGDPDRAMQLYQEGLNLDTSVGDIRGKALILQEMANILSAQGDFDRAMKLYEESLEIKNSFEDRRGRAATLHAMAHILTARDKIDEALKFYEESLEIVTDIGDIRARAAILHQVAWILHVKGDYEGAVKLYMESLEIDNSLGHPEGSAITKGTMALVLWEAGQREAGIRYLLEGLSQLVELRIEPKTQQAMAEDLRRWRKEIGTEQFDPLWQKVAGGPLPDWLAAAEPDKEEGGMSVADWARMTIRAARAKAPDCKQLFEMATQVQKDHSMAEPVRKLASVLLKILAGNFSPDLSGLPEDLANLVRETLAEGQEAAG